MMKLVAKQLVVIGVRVQELMCLLGVQALYVLVILVVKTQHGIVIQKLNAKLLEQVGVELIVQVHHVQLAALARFGTAIQRVIVKLLAEAGARTLEPRQVQVVGVNLILVQLAALARFGTAIQRVIVKLLAEAGVAQIQAIPQ